jgi:hypothetical protein
VDDSDLHAYYPAWDVTDNDGHGTEMAGLALYGDLVEVLAGAGPVQLTHNLESVKILPPVARIHHICTGTSLLNPLRAPKFRTRFRIEKSIQILAALDTFMGYLLRVILYVIRV